MVTVGWEIPIFFKLIGDRYDFGIGDTQTEILPESLRYRRNLNFEMIFLTPLRPSNYLP